MRIAVNTRHLIPDRLEGIGRFAHETLKRITQDHPEHEFIFIFDRKYGDEFIYASNVIPVNGFPPARHPFLWYAFFEWSIPDILQKYQPSVFYSPDGWMSLNTKIPSIPVIHDLNFMHMPELLPRMVRRYYRYFFPKFVKKASRIITVSEFSKQDIVSTFNYDERMIDVVYNGADEGFVPLDSNEQEKVRDEFSQGCPYFLFIGLIHPRKNLSNIIRAFNSFRQQELSNIKLLVIGEKKWWDQDVQNAYDQCEFMEDIVFLGRVNPPKLNKILASALALVYVSHFEGFGIPILEAMYSEIPVICSNVTSMPEVGGDAALYADPSDPDSIKVAMISVYKDPQLSKSILNKAKIQRSKFSWDKTAAAVWSSMEKSWHER